MYSFNVIATKNVAKVVYVNIAQKTFHLLEIVYNHRKKILLNEKAAYQPYIQSAENILLYLFSWFWVRYSYN